MAINHLRHPRLKLSSRHHLEPAPLLGVASSYRPRSAGAPSSRRGLSGRVGLSLLTACFAQVPAVCQITVRADAGFFSRKVVEAIEARQGKLVIVAQLTRPPPKATEAYFHLLFLPATR